MRARKRVVCVCVYVCACMCVCSYACKIVVVVIITMRAVIPDQSRAYRHISSNCLLKMIIILLIFFIWMVHLESIFIVVKRYM